MTAASIAAGRITMKILVTGAAGFLGTRLIRALLAAPPGLDRVSRVIAADTAPCDVRDPRVDARTGTIADERFVKSLIDPDVDAVCHLAAVLSGEAERDFDLGLQINVDATRGLLETCRRAGHRPRFVFTSTTAVFGGPLPPVVPETMAVTPQSSYGTEKAICELLVTDYSRRGYIDGIVCRVPTVAVRPGAPNSALSSFVSGIIREPLAGIDAVCPVPLDMPLWISSPDAVTANLVRAIGLPASALEGRRVINLPGVSVTAGEMLDSLGRLGGTAARARVRCDIDETTRRIVGGWPAALDVSRPARLGFVTDDGIDAIIRQYMDGQKLAS